LRWVRRVHSRADRTLAPSSDSVRELLAHGVPRVHRWGRGVDIERFSPSHADPALRAELAPNGELLVGFVGRLAPEKEIDRLVTLAGVPGVRVVVVGDGPELAGLRDRIPGAAFLGAKYGDELSAAYASLDVFVHTGPHETFCQAVQEAMASGLPVLAPDAGGPRDLVLHGRTGFLLPADRTRFAEQLLARVDELRDPALRERLGQKARRVVLGRTWPAVCGELMGHYEAVAGRAAQAA
ncbi:glycosyltransferase, partial [Amycolatopsis magusensis]|uniref:glycosyltransferase n=1 Tax=Amycolatopsis magusensis TaxID=882444 RepID=UPI0024A846CB